MLFTNAVTGVKDGPEVSFNGNPARPYRPLRSARLGIVTELGCL